MFLHWKKRASIPVVQRNPGKEGVEQQAGGACVEGEFYAPHVLREWNVMQMIPSPDRMEVAVIGIAGKGLRVACRNFFPGWLATELVRRCRRAEVAPSIPSPVLRPMRSPLPE